MCTWSSDPRAPAPEYRPEPVDLDGLSHDLHDRFDAKTAARERALPAARRSIRASANSIRAIHRLELDRAKELIEESRAALEDGFGAVGDHPDVRFAGYLQDAEKEYAEANVTYALVAGQEVPTPEGLGVGDAPFLNGMAEAIGEGRRRILDLLRTGEVAEGEALLAAMEEIYGVLVTMDYPDAITLNLRRSTDVARSLIEKTRGDLAIAFMQREMRDALDEHARRLKGEA
jgi:translin